MNAKALLLGMGLGVAGSVGLSVLFARSSKPGNSSLHSSSSTTHPILLLVNGHLETMALVNAFHAVESNSPTQLSFGQLYHAANSVTIFSVGNMVGEESVVTALCALLSSRLNYSLVILIGSCGAISTQTKSSSSTDKTELLKQQLGIGDVVAAFPTTCYFERRIAAFGPVSKRFGIGETPTWEYTDNVARLTEIDLCQASYPTRVASAKIASGRSFETDSTGIEWMRDMHVTGKDMEAAAAISTCQQFGVPATALKVVVDLVDLVDTESESESETTKSGLTTGGRLGDVIAMYDTNLSDCVVTLARTATTFVNRAQEQLERTARQAMLFSQEASFDTAHVVAIHVAMQEEARPIAASLGLTPTILAPFARHGMMCWNGTFQQVPIVMVCHGRDHQLGLSRVSTQIATLCVNIICRTYSGRLRALINCGTAGAMNGKGLDIGSIVVANEVKFIDARGLEGRSEHERKDQLHLWREMSELIVKNVNNVRSGTVGTGSSFDLSPSDLTSLKQLGADVKEMEAAAVVWTCNRFDVPVVVVKSITDFVEVEHDEDGANEFTQNLWGKALQTLSAVMPKVVSVVAAAVL